MRSVIWSSDDNCMTETSLTTTDATRTKFLQEKEAGVWWFGCRWFLPSYRFYQNLVHAIGVFVSRSHGLLKCLCPQTEQRIWLWYTSRWKLALCLLHFKINSGMRPVFLWVYKQGLETHISIVSMLQGFKRLANPFRGCLTVWWPVIELANFAWHISCFKTTKGWSQLHEASLSRETSLDIVLLVIH